MLTRCHKTGIMSEFKDVRVCVCVYQAALLTTWHEGRWRGGCADAATQLTNSGKSSWKAAMVLQHRESPDHTSKKHMNAGSMLEVI